MESAELEEFFLRKDAESARQMRADAKAFGRFREKVADIGAYILSLADVLDIDLSEAITERIEQNSRRDPISRSKGTSGSTPESG